MRVKNINCFTSASSGIALSPVRMGQPKRASSFFSDRKPVTREGNQIYQLVIQGLQKLAQYHSSDSPVSPLLLRKMENLIDQGVGIEPEYPGLWIARGQLSLMQEDFTSAIRDFSQALDLEAQFNDNYWGGGDALLGRGYAHYFSGNVEQGYEDWRLAADMGNEAAKELVQTYNQ